MDQRQGNPCIYISLSVIQCFWYLLIWDLGLTMYLHWFISSWNIWPKSEFSFFCSIFLDLCWSMEEYSNTNPCLVLHLHSRRHNQDPVKDLCWNVLPVQNKETFSVLFISLLSIHIPFSKIYYFEIYLKGPHPTAINLCVVLNLIALFANRHKRSLLYCFKLSQQLFQDQCFLSYVAILYFNAVIYRLCYRVFLQ